MFTNGSFQLALDNFRQGDLKAANTRFSYIVDVSPLHWEARLYLAMTQIRMNDHRSGMENMRYLVEHCPDPEIRVKAQISMSSMAAVAVAAGRTTGDESDEEDLEVIFRKGGRKRRGKIKPIALKPRKRFFFWQK
jgi:hypothetical protein